MTAHMDPETVARMLIDEGFTRGRLEVVDTLVAEDLVEHQEHGPGHPSGPEGVRAVIAYLHRAFADFRLTVEDLVVVGDTVWMRNVATGTHEGPFMGFLASGRPIRVDVIDILRVVDGIVVEHWGVPDRLGALLQTGSLPPPVPAGAAR